MARVVKVNENNSSEKGYLLKGLFFVKANTLAEAVEIVEKTYPDYVITYAEPER